ncbi:MAG TPA: MFS transporter [Dehalococcoidia bacterium]|nr:MFS transporter [Dehalococcoidia bacterium]
MSSVSTSRRRGFVVLSVLGAGAFMGAWNFTFLAPVLPEVADDTGVSVTAAGQLVTVSALVTVVFLVLLGPLADRYGKRPMLMMGLAAMGLAALGSSLTSSYGALIALRVLSGIGDALVLPSAASAVADYFDGKDREVALNVLLVPLGAAVVLGLPVVVLVSEVASWHGAFLVFAGLTLVVVMGVGWLLPRPAVASRARRSLREHYRESYGEVLGTRLALAVLGAAVLGATVWNGMVTYAGAFFQDELGARAAGLSALFAALGASYVAGGAVGVALARRLRPRVIALWSAVAAVALLLPVVAATDLAPVAITLALGFAGSRAPGIAALNNMLLDLAPRAGATAVSTYGVVAAMGALLGAASGGLAIAVEGYLGMAALFTMLAVGAALLLTRPDGGIEAAASQV